jgi:hypothetical protein
LLCLTNGPKGVLPNISFIKLIDLLPEIKGRGEATQNRHKNSIQRRLRQYGEMLDIPPQNALLLMMGF